MGWFKGGVGGVGWGSKFCDENSLPSHLGKHSNFKINYENGQYFINTKKKFDSMKQLLECYHNAPIKSKQKDTEIYLLFPIPADEELELQFEKEAEAMKGKGRREGVVGEGMDRCGDRGVMGEGWEEGVW